WLLDAGHGPAFWHDMRPRGPTRPLCHFFELNQSDNRKLSGFSGVVDKLDRCARRATPDVILAAPTGGKAGVRSWRARAAMRRPRPLRSWLRRIRLLCLPFHVQLGVYETDSRFRAG